MPVNRLTHITPRDVIIAAAGSGAGKTTVTLGLLCAPKRRGVVGATVPECGSRRSAVTGTVVHIVDVAS
jgi:hypothetical protein